jgi:hypothetical protein
MNNDKQKGHVKFYVDGELYKTHKYNNRACRRKAIFDFMQSIRKIWYRINYSYEICPR